MATYSSVPSGRGRGHRRGESRRPGQWKLAYADFLTALMAFFLLMWLSTGSSQAERTAIAAYFTGAEIVDGRETNPSSVFDIEAALLAELAGSALFEQLSESVEVRSSEIGLRLEVTDGGQSPLFDTASGELNNTGQSLVAEIGRAIALLPVDVSIEGHTDAFVDSANEAANWHLSSARAQSALVTLQTSGISTDRFAAVTGLAATQPLQASQPHASVNRRVSIVLELSAK